MAQLTISEARRGLLDLPRKLGRGRERTATITRHGRPVLAIMTWDLYESIVETLDVLSDPEMAVALRESLEDLTHGRLVNHEEAGKRLGA